jgi:Asp-tRNA(Asn)/Glu-tRNA(Gln) amidotransferase A subunit family amidase
MSELWSLPASEVARLVRTRKVSAREVADSALQRLDSVNPRITAIVDCRPDLVREQADRVDSVLASENDPGPLAGVPVTVKLTLTRQGLPRAMAAGCKKTSSPNSTALPWTMWCGQVQWCLGVATCQRLPCVGLRATCSMAAHTHTTHVIRC